MDGDQLSAGGSRHNIQLKQPHAAASAIVQAIGGYPAFMRRAIEAVAALPAEYQPEEAALLRKRVLALAPSQARLDGRPGRWLRSAAQPVARRYCAFGERRRKGDGPTEVYSRLQAYPGSGPALHSAPVQCAATKMSDVGG